MGLPHPHHTGHCLGHQKLKDIINNQITQNCLGPSWLLSGDKGIGKATFAYYYSYLLLENNFSSEDIKHTRAYTLIDQQIHPDFYLLEAEEEQDITVEEIRKLTHFLQKMPLLGKRRIGIIDGANLMTRQAANALLKTLENPPSYAVLFLINHGSVLPTLKSRCQQLLFYPLEIELTEKILKPYLEAYSQDQQEMLLTYLQGHPGVFKYFEGDKITILENLKRFGEKGYSYTDVLTFADSFKDHPKSVYYGILFWIADLMKQSSNKDDWLSKGAETWLEIDKLFKEYYFSNTDFSHFLIIIFEKIHPWLESMLKN